MIILIDDLGTIYKINKEGRLMSRYYVLEDNFPRQDFRYNKEGSYLNSPPTNVLRRRKGKVDRNDVRGSICPACGITRSSNNKCECNS